MPIHHSPSSKNQGVPRVPATTANVDTRSGARWRRYPIVGCRGAAWALAGVLAACAAPRSSTPTSTVTSETPPPASAEEGAPGRTATDDRAEEGASSGDAPKTRSGAKDAPDKTKKARPKPPATAGVKAGAADDNVQFNAFLRFAADNRRRGLPFAAERRRVISVRDRRGRPWPGARVALVDKQRVVASRRTYADGRTLLFPEAANDGDQRFVLRVEVDGQPALERPLGARRAIDFEVPYERPSADVVPLDIVFVLDTTGSMQDEIDKLRDTLNVINFQINHAQPRPDVRYAMVLYRDRGDAYRTRVVPFTASLDEFSAELAKVSAGGGDDYPEDVQAGLEAALTQLRWIDHGVKLAFLIGDAPPHLDYGQSFTYLTAAERAAQRGIKIATIGASGLNRTGELVWRQIAQQTMAPFVFLTYGEKGDAEGSPSSVSHHVGANWVADDLDAIIIRLVKHELAYWRPRGAPEREDYFIARPNPQRPPSEVLDELFSQSAQQLVDYSLESIAPRTPTVLLPLHDDDTARGRSLERRLAVGLSRQGRFQLVEKERRTDVLKILADQMASTYDEARMVEIGKMVPARLAVLGTIDPNADGPVELLVKLVRLETGEVLSLSLMRIDAALL